MDETAILKALSSIRSGKERKFEESVDLIINLKNLDFTRPDNKIDLKVALPSGRGKPVKVAIFGDADFTGKAKNADLVILESDLNKEPKEMKKIAEDVSFFVAQTTLMVTIGKTWGKVLGSRGKMPQPLPPQVDATPIIERLKNTVSLKSKGKTPQTLHCAIGVKSMDDKELLENIKTVINALTEKLPNREQNIKSIFVKTTMGAPVRIG